MNKLFIYSSSYFIVHLAAAFLEPANFGFLKPHRMNGIIHAVGEESESDVWRLKADDDGIFVSRGRWTDLAMREVFKVDPDHLDRWTDDASRHVAIDFVHRPSFASWDAWARIPDFTLPHDEALVRAHHERS